MRKIEREDMKKIPREREREKERERERKKETKIKTAKNRARMIQLDRFANCESTLKVST